MNLGRLSHLTKIGEILSFGYKMDICEFVFVADVLCSVHAVFVLSQIAL